MRLILLRLSALAVAALVSLPLHAEVFVLDSTSAYDYSGSLTLTAAVIGQTPVTSTGSFTATKPGSLHTGLQGTINAVVSGDSLTFTGGSQVSFTNPEAIDLTVDFPNPNSTTFVRLTASFTNVVYDITGTTTLVGAPGNQSFDTSGLQLITKGGTAAFALYVCSPTCGAPVAQDSGPLVQPGDTPDILNAGQGSLLGANAALAFPITFGSPIELGPFSADVAPGVTATISFNGSELTTANVSAAVPEPSEWSLAAVGLAIGSVFFRVMRRRAG